MLEIDYHNELISQLQPQKNNNHETYSFTDHHLKASTIGQSAAILSARFSGLQSSSVSDLKIRT